MQWRMRIWSACKSAVKDYTPSGVKVYSTGTFRIAKCNSGLTLFFATKNGMHWSPSPVSSYSRYSPESFFKVRYANNTWIAETNLGIGR